MGAIRTHLITEDLSSKEGPENVAKKVIEEFGQIDILINNAGQSVSANWDSHDDLWAKSFNLNFHAARRLTTPLIPIMKKNKWGRIINITGGKDITLYEVDEAANRIKQEVDEEANIIYGTTCDDRLDGLVRVSIVATGIDSNVSINAKPLESFAPIKINNDVYKSDQIIQENEQNFQEINSDIENDQEVQFSENNSALSIEDHKEPYLLHSVQLLH